MIIYASDDLFEDEDGFLICFDCIWEDGDYEHRLFRGVNYFFDEIYFEKTGNFKLKAVKRSKEGECDRCKCKRPSNG